MASRGKIHVVLFPWLAFGHIIPYLELAKLIAQRGHKVSFISTPRNIARLPKLPPDLRPLISFVKFPLPKSENLPEDAEATIDVPRHKVRYLKIAYDELQQPMSQFLETASPDWILHDFTAYWLSPIAQKLNISCCFFHICIVCTLSFLGPPISVINNDGYRKSPEDYTIPGKWIPFKTTVVPKLFEINRLFKEFTEDDGNVSDGFRFANSVIGCDFLAVRSCPEFEPEWFPVVEKLYEKKIIPVGHLPTTEYNEDGEYELNQTWVEMKAWLDKQTKGSVVYVAFGSETKPSQEELTEIAFGLELSGLPFFWAHRNQRGSADTELTQLPKGFEERTKRRGLIYTTWVPQLRLLSHDSVGGLLSHSGWSSTVEAVQFGKALILLPFLADQGLLARFVEEKKMGYSIRRDEKDGSFTRESVAESLRLVLVGDEGKIYRDKAKEMRDLFGDRDKQIMYVENLLGYLQKQKAQKSIPG